MTPPDLSTPQGVAAYRRELRGVARVWRLSGLLVALTGMMLMQLTGKGVPQLAGILILGLGLGLMIVGAIARRRYHLKRLERRG